MNRNLRLCSALCLGVVSLASPRAHAADPGPSPAKPEVIANLIRGIANGANEECLVNKIDVIPGTADEVAGVCAGIAGCITAAITAAPALQNELYDAFTRHLPAEPVSIPMTLAAMHKCSESSLSAAQAKPGSK